MIVSWQEWVIIVVLLICVERIGNKAYHFFRSVQKDENPCANCASDCMLKQMYDEKRAECARDKKKTKKSCSG